MSGHAHPEPRPAAHSERPSHLRALAGGALLLVLLWLLPSPAPASQAATGLTLEHGRITALGALDPVTGSQTAAVQILDGPRAGEAVVAEISGAAGALGPGGGGLPNGGEPGNPYATPEPVPSAPSESESAAPVTPLYAIGDEVILQVSASPEGEYIAVSDRWRVPLLGGTLAVFALLVLLVAGWRGLRALLALAFTVVAVVKILLPLLAAGWDPVLLAVVTGSAVTVITLLLTEGWSRSMLAAAIGTFGALVATAVMAALVTDAARLSILQGNEELAYLRGLIGTDFDLSGLLLASIILGALGVLDDVTVTQAVTVEELAHSDPAASRATLAGRAMRIGRAHIAATVNTLVLAYVAASLPLLLLFGLSPQPLGALASGESITIEVLRSIVGSVGIVLAVPFTTFIAARLVPRGA